MGYRDNLTKLSQVLMAAFGETVTFTPASEYFSPFECAADFFAPEHMDAPEPHVVLDRCLCRVRHADLAAHGIAGPVKQMMGQKGDTISRLNLNGEIEIWEVTEATAEVSLGEWTLELKRNIRVVP